MVLLDAAAASDTVTIVLAALNVLQTIALAYLAARAHVDRHNGAANDDAAASGARKP